jgi:hypothetical protein
VEELCSSAGGEVTVDELAILEFIKNTTMVGLLPVPHPIVIRKYQPNHYTGLWFTAFMWGVIFLQNQLLPLYDGASIKLFTVRCSLLVACAPPISTPAPVLSRAHPSAPPPRVVLPFAVLSLPTPTGTMH